MEYRPTQFWIGVHNDDVLQPFPTHGEVLQLWRLIRDVPMGRFGRGGEVALCVHLLQRAR